eukprot:13071891-Alexandrium_andersonii.AAC.1
MWGSRAVPAHSAGAPAPLWQNLGGGSPADRRKQNRHAGVAGPPPATRGANPRTKPAPCARTPGRAASGGRRRAAPRDRGPGSPAPLPRKRRWLRTPG